MSLAARIRTSLVALLLIGIALFSAAVALDVLGALRNGMRINSFTLVRGGRYFEVPKGGGPIDGRNFTEISLQQFESRQRYKRWSGALLLVGVILIMGSGRVSYRPSPLR